MQKLPIGIQSFKKIRETQCIYIDKTKEALSIVSHYSYAFLSRPRRFGKSLFLDTLSELFACNKELFTGLYIYDNWDWSQKYPVIKISWDGNLRSIEDIEQTALDMLRFNQEKLDINCENSTNSSSCFRELIQKTYKKYNQKVVILIDEYDKPILDNLDQIEISKEIREYIKGFYSIIKGSDEFIRFAFLTGVSKFSKASIFSGLNMLTDISLDEEYGNICGYTQNDIDTRFQPYLKDVDMQRFKRYYDGYNFLKDDIYNPFDTLQFIAKKFKYKNYWFETGTPTFLIKLIKQNHYFLPKLSNLVVDEKLLSSFDIENLDLEVILYQAGYLTIDKVIEDEYLGSISYKLRLPNQEVEKSFNSYIIDTLLKQSTDKLIFQKNIYMALLRGEVDSFVENLKAIFASIPYNNYANNKINTYEGFYASVVYIYLQSLGLKIIGEDVTNRGRIDLSVIIDEKVYIIEFKVIDDDQNVALEQIKEKKYYEKYQSFEAYLVGINFNKNDKNICSYSWEKL